MIAVIHADITTLVVDAVVNAANSGLRGGAGADGAIHRAAGPGLAAACRSLGGCPVGQARVTPGFRLPARWIVHAVGPVWHGGGRGEDGLLRAAYEDALRLALAQGARSIAFPCISTGAYSFPKARAAQIAVAALCRFEGSFERIVACCFTPEDAALYRAALDSG